MAGLKSRPFKTKTGSEGHSQQTAGFSAAPNDGAVWLRSRRQEIGVGAAEAGYFRVASGACSGCSGHAWRG